MKRAIVLVLLILTSALASGVQAGTVKVNKVVGAKEQLIL